jgi:hypothetical protein
LGAVILIASAEPEKHFLFPDKSQAARICGPCCRE